MHSEANDEEIWNSSFIIAVHSSSAISHYGYSVATGTNTSNVLRGNTGTSAQYSSTHTVPKKDMFYSDSLLSSRY